MRLRPINEKIVVKRLESEESSLIPEQYRKKGVRGEVLAVGEGLLLPSGVRAVPLVKAGDIVTFQERGVVEIELDKEKYLVMTENEILFVESGKNVNKEKTS